MVDRGQTITLNTVAYTVDKDRSEALRFKMDRVPNSQENAAARQGAYEQIVVPFGMNGIGQTYDLGIPQEIDDAVDVQMEIPGELGPGLEVNSLGYSGAQVIRLVPIADDNGRILVYAAGAGGIGVLKKINLDDTGVSATGQPTDISGASKTFTHGTSTRITDVVVLKSGQLPGLVGRYGSQPGNGRFIVLFGETATIYQCDTVHTGTSADSYNSGAVGLTMYGGRGIVGVGNTVTASRIYLSAAWSGTSTGPFSRVAAMDISTSAFTDYTSSANYTATPYQVGNPSESINDFAEFQNGIAVAMPSGVYGMRADGNSYSIMTFKSFKDVKNGRNLTAWRDNLFAPTRVDIATPQGMVGIREPQLESQQSRLGVYPTALAPWGDDLFVAYYDGTDSWVYRLRPRRGRSVSNAYLAYPVTKRSGKEITSLLCVTNSYGSTFLLIGSDDVHWILIDPPSRYRYKSGGLHYSPTYGYDVPVVVERITFPYLAGNSASNYITPSISFDGGTSYNTLSALTSTGRQTITTTPGSNDNGPLFKLKLAWTVASNTARPRIINPPGKRGDAGGVVIDLRRLPVGTDATDVFEAVLVVGQDTTHGLSQSLPTAITALKALEGTIIDCVYRNHFGDASSHKVTVLSVSYVTGPGDSAQNGEFYVTVRFKTMMGTT